jgi:hypothetical protein
MEECFHAVRRATQHEIRPIVRLVLGRPATGGKRMYLAGRGSPLAEILCENRDGNAVVAADALQVLRWLVEVVFRTPSEAGDEQVTTNQGA